MLKAIIVDDDLPFAKFLQSKIQNHPFAQDMDMEIDIIDNPLECLKRKKVYDIYFLDIHMPQLSGIELAKALRGKYIDKEFIFVSGYNQCMRKSIYVKPRAYVRKKYLDEDLEETLSVLSSFYEKDKPEIIVKDNGSDVKVRPRETVYITSEGHYVFIYDVDNEKKVIRNKINNLESKMRKFDFIRVHSRYLINLNFMKEYDKNKIVLRNETIVPISYSYKEKVLELVMNWMLKDRKVKSK